MFFAVVTDEVAAGAGLFHFGGERLDGGIGDGGVGFAVEDKGGRGVLGDVVPGGDAGAIDTGEDGARDAAGGPRGESFIAGDGGEDQSRIEQDEGGDWRFGDHGGYGREHAPGGAAASGDAGRGDTETGGVGLDVVESGTGVGDAVGNSGLMASFDAVISGDGDEAERGQAAAVLFELDGAAMGPASAEEEDDGGAGRGFLRGIEDVEVELGVGDGCVRFDFGALHLGWIGEAAVLGEGDSGGEDK